MATPSQQPKPAAASPALARLAAQPQIEFELDFFAALLERRPDFVEALKAHAKNLALARRHHEGCSSTGGSRACGRRCPGPIQPRLLAWC